MPAAVELTGDRLTIEDVWDVAVARRPAALGDLGRERAAAARTFLASQVGDHTYGVNTGFGRFVSETIPPEQAIKWLTINPAWALGLDDRIGSLEPGKNADLVLWSGDPFSVYTRAEKVWIDGALRFDRAAPATRWRTDFELGFVPAETR